MILMFVGCSNKNINVNEKRQDFTTYKEYPNISKDAVFEAAKKVFILSGKDKFRIDSYRNNLVVSKTEMVHYPFYIFMSEDRWNLTVEEVENSSKAKLSLLRVTDYDEEDPKYLNTDMHNLLWKRIDYLLGLDDNWVSCMEYHLSLNIDSALCDDFDVITSTKPTKDDIIKNILITQRMNSKSVVEIDNDILKEDIDFSIDDTKTDILQKEDIIDIEVNNENTLNNSLDKDIEELDRKVNSNIDENLDKIEENIEDEPESE
jgi:hypothetical protein